MLIYPAIDLRGGKVVRLKEGDYKRETVYGDDPLATAQSFRAQGATHLHVVDLDGARGGVQQNYAAIDRIVRQSGLFVEVGGGARDEASAKRLFDAGVGRVILGTAAVENPALVEALAAMYPGKIAAGVDARDGFVAIHGWRMVTDIPSFEFVKHLPSRGVSTVIYTDIARDGMLSGPNFDAYEALAGIPGLAVIASGGVTAEEDVRRLAALRIEGAIIGKSIYDGRIDLACALRIAREAAPC